jgi:DNA-binding transcriptional LysR family regulator
VDLRRIDLNLLVALDALLQERNVTRASERLQLSQPTVSSALARLRKLFGDPLLIRTGRQMQLTPRAESLVGPVGEALTIINAAIEQRPVFDPRHDPRTFTVMASDYASLVLVRPVLRSIAGWAPEVRVRIRQVVDLVSALERDEVDVVVVPDRAVDLADLPSCSHRLVLRDEWVAVVWRDAASVGQVVTRTDLEKLPHLAYAPPSGRAMTDVAMEELGMRWRVEAEVSNFTAMPFLLRGTDMVALIPGKLATEMAAMAQLRVVPLEIRVPPLEESMYWHARRDHDSAHRWLRDQFMALSPELQAPPAD